MKRIVLLAPTPPPVGGIASWTERMIQAVFPNDWAVVVVDEKIVGNREFFGNKTRLNIKNEVIRCFRIWNGLRKELEKENTKVVHACIPANTLPVLREFISACITKIYQKKFIIHFRCTVPIMVKSKLNTIVVKMLCRIADCAMLLNQQSVHYINSLTNTKTFLIPNFVDNNEVVREHLIKPKIKRALYVGGVIETKGCLDIIEVAKHFPGIEFRLVGNAEEKCINAAKKVNNIILVGTKKHEEIAQELAEADVFLFLTYFAGEGFSNSLAEAMAAGLPCIVTDWAANADMIENEGGIVVPVKDTNAVIKAIEYLKNPEIRKQCSGFNIQKVINSYSASVIQNKYVQCYEELIK